MKPHLTISICVLACFAFAGPPKLPRKVAATEIKGATLLIQKTAAVVSGEAVSKSFKLDRFDLYFTP